MIVLRDKQLLQSCVFLEAFFYLTEIYLLNRYSKRILVFNDIKNNIPQQASPKISLIYITYYNDVANIKCFYH